MDYILCGMPRGGTTGLGQMFNAHEQVYCYFMETGLFRHLHTFGRDRPFPSENLPILEEWLREQLRGTLIEGTADARIARFKRLQVYLKELAKHGLAEPSGPGLRLVEAEDFEPFLQDVLDLFRAGLHGTQLLAAGMELLDKYIRKRTQRAVIGEKTPDNLFFVDALYDIDPGLKVFCILREPYSTLESMKRRASRDDHFFDSAFSKEVLGGIAEYYRHLRAAYDLSLRNPPDKFRVLRFEDMYADSVQFMASIYRDLGLEITQSARQILPKLHIPTDKHRTRKFHLTREEHALIAAICGEMLEHFGYDVAPDDDAQPISSESTEGVIALSGIHLEGAVDKSLTHKWMEKDATLFLLFDGGRDAFAINMHCYFPEALGLDRVTVRFHSGEREILSVDIDPRLPDHRFEIPLQDLDYREVTGSLRGLPLSISSSVSFSPITVPGLGPDMRDLSFLISSCEFTSKTVPEATPETAPSDVSCDTPALQSPTA